jgi:transglutaminase-like putative cysteine protease
MTLPSTFARSTPSLLELAAEMGATRRDDPLTLLREINEGIYQSFAYSPKSTHARSPIDESLAVRSGVCQDFAHIFIALARSVGIPCRYVSGYLFHRTEGDHPDRSAEDGSHAWAEAFLPGIGWVGFDPTNNLLAGERHIRVAIGRDYADVPPTKGLFKGNVRSRLHVGVRVAEAKFPLSNQSEPDMALVTQGDDADLPPGVPIQAQQQQ